MSDTIIVNGALLRLAVTQKVQGKSAVEIAQGLPLTPDELEQLPYSHPRQWDRYYGRATELHQHDRAARCSAKVEELFLNTTDARDFPHLAKALEILARLQAFKTPRTRKAKLAPSASRPSNPANSSTTNTPPTKEERADTRSKPPQEANSKPTAPAQETKQAPKRANPLQSFTMLLVCVAVCVLSVASRATSKNTPNTSEEISFEPQPPVKQPSVRQPESIKNLSLPTRTSAVPLSTRSPPTP